MKIIKNPKSHKKLRERKGKTKSARVLYYINDKRLYKSFVWDTIPELRKGNLASLKNWRLCPSLVGSRSSFDENPASGASTQ